MLIVALVAAALGTALLAACGSSGGSSGGGSDQFRDKTHSPLLDFGEESSEGEMEEAAEAVSSFLSARSQEDWPATCAQLSSALLAKIEHLAISSTDLEDKSCPSFLEAFLSVSAQERRQNTEIDGGSLRQKGTRGFLIYLGARENVYAMPLSKEDGAWKVDSLSSKLLD